MKITEGGSQFMAKAKRGKNIKTLGWRGTCPSCNKTGVKLLWEKDKLHVCKACGK
jgi:rRNA maturation endonuclease Nob1